MFKDFYSLLISLQTPHIQLLNILPPYEHVTEFERRLRERGKLTFEKLFQEPLGNFVFRQYLKKFGVVDHAVFLSDISIYKTLSSDFAKQTTAKRIFDHFLGPCSVHHLEDSSVFSEEYSEPDPPFLNYNAVRIEGFFIEKVRTSIENNDCTATLFDPFAMTVSRILRTNYQAFLKSEHFKYLICCKSLELKGVSIKMFQVVDVLGHGAFGHVNMCLKIDSCMFYAVKVVSKKRLVATNMVNAIMAERDFLATVKSNFVLSLNYAVMDTRNIYLVLDLMVGGDLKHVLQNTTFDEKTTRFYAAQLILGLSHIHEQQIIYRDMKLENVLLDERGNCRISDLGLAVRMKRVRGYAGTPGYVAPEVIMGTYYDRMVDFFSLGVLLYRMVLSRKPFVTPNTSDAQGNNVYPREIDAAVVNIPPDFSNCNLEEETVDFFRRLLEKRPNHRLGRQGYDEIKEHDFFRDIDFGMIEAGCVKPPIVPKPQNLLRPPRCAHPPPVLNRENSSSVTEALQQPLKSFCYKSKRAVQREILHIFSYFAQKEPNFFDYLLQGRNAQEALCAQPTGNSLELPSSCCSIS